MTVSKLIEWLKTQDQDAIVSVVVHTSGRGYYDQGGTAEEVVFDPSLHVEAYGKELLLGVFEG